IGASVRRTASAWAGLSGKDMRESGPVVVVGTYVRPAPACRRGFAPGCRARMSAPAFAPPPGGGCDAGTPMPPPGPTIVPILSTAAPRVQACRARGDADASSARYAIGDLQGCHEARVQLLELVGFSPATDRLRLVGDLVSRGPGSLPILREVKALGDAARVVLGNHDFHLLTVA